jgi:Flp pilus assembly protein TadG
MSERVTMSIPRPAAAGQKALSWRSTLRRFAPDTNGDTLLEFSIVAMPFLMFVIALILCALYFFTFNSVERGMDQTARLVLTGQAAKNKMTVAQFKEKLCNDAGSLVNCTRMQVFAEHWSGWDQATSPHRCLESNGTASQNGAPPGDQIATYTGTASDVVIVTVCYKWEYASKLPFIKLGNMTDGSMMIQTSTAFRTEPFPTGS